MHNDIIPEGYQTPHFLPTVPTAMEKSSDEKRQATLDQLPLLKEVVTHLDDRIEATDSVKQALVLAETHNVTKENALIILDIVRQQIETERSFINSRLDSL